MREILFRGLSGKGYTFIRMAVNAPWARETGIALFAARGPFGWRVVRVMEMRGRLHDVQPIWAYADAERYGANTVFLLQEADKDMRHRIYQDLQSGLNPVLDAVAQPEALAA